MKKIASVLLALIMVMSLTACGSKEEPAQTEENVSAEEQNAETTDHSTEIALVMSAEGSVDDRGFFQGAYEGIQKFCGETDYTYGYYHPTDNSADALFEVMDLAVLNGVKVFVIAGTNFIGIMEDVFAAYPDCYFICNDLQDTEAADNSLIYLYKAQEATFLAGVAAVYEGYNEIGVMCGMQIPSNLNGGYGFMEGVNWAAGKLGVEDINLKYWYTNSFDPSADIQAYAAAWYENGTEMIAAFCGPAAPSIYAAAEGAGGKTMGADTDQSGFSDTVITTFLKNVNVMTYTGLKDWEAGNPQTGIKEVGIVENAVGLVMDNARFETFTQKELDEVIEKYLAGEITIKDYTAADRPDDFFSQMEPKNITFTYYE